MARFDLPLAELESYASRTPEPAGFDAFWDATLAEHRDVPLDVRLAPVETGLRTVVTEDLTYAGFGGQDVRGWVTRPAASDAAAPVVVQFVGYGGGRGLPHEHLLWASAGFVHVVMDTRGQGAEWSVGDTGDDAASGPQRPGFRTRGIDDPATYYYRRVFVDAVRAVQVARSLDGVDATRTAVVGGSQGGGIGLAVSALLPRVGADLTALVCDVPFLCDVRRAVEITDAEPYAELVGYLAQQRGRAERALRTIDHVDGVAFARRATAPVLFSVGLMDEVCPPSTVYAAFNAYGGPKEIAVYPYNGHEHGEGFQAERALRFVAARAGGAAPDPG